MQKTFPSEANPYIPGWVDPPFSPGKGKTLIIGYDNKHGVGVRPWQRKPHGETHLPKERRTHDKLTMFADTSK